MLTDAPQQALKETPRPGGQSRRRSRGSSRRPGRRRRGSGGITQVRDGVWRVDVEISRDPLTGKRRRISRRVSGTREDAEVALAKLRVADHDLLQETGQDLAQVARAVRGPRHSHPV